MANKISMRMQTPADKSGVRTDIHPITTTDEVIVDANSSNPITLTEKLNKMGGSGFVIQDTQPDYPCLWAKPIR